MHNFTNYLEQANEFMISASSIRDFAVASAKLCDPNNVGNTNSAWRTPPFLSTPAGVKQMPHKYPYVFRISEAHSKVISLVVGLDPATNQIPRAKTKHSSTDAAVARLSMITQFEILKDYLKTLKFPLSKKSNKFVGNNAVSEDLVKLKKELADRRNELVHEIDPPLPTMSEAVIYFLNCRYLAFEAARTLGPVVGDGSVEQYQIDEIGIVSFKDVQS